MDQTLVPMLGILSLFVLIALNIPVSFAMLLVGFAGVYHIIGSAAAFNVISAGIWEQLSSYPLSVIPLFILMGEILSRSGITKQLMTATYAWVGHRKGAMASTAILTGVGFGAVCGSNSATTAAVGTIALPEMKRYGYHPSLSAGVVAAAGTLGTIIPPSAVLIIVALQAELAIRDLFLASVVPAMLLVSLFLLTIGALCLRNPAMGPAGTRTAFLERLKSLKGVIETVILFCLVLGGLFAGWFTSTEAAAVGCLGAFIICASQRRVSWSSFKDAIKSTLAYSAMILMLITGAVVFGRFLAITRLPFIVAEWATQLPLPAIAIMATILLIFLIGGAIMDAMGFLVIAMPIFFPVAMSLGYEPIWFGVMVCIATGMGAITPPIAVNAFIVHSLDPTLSFRTIMSGICYFLPAFLVTLILLLVFPGIVMFVL
tara:strand:- start:62730 stop:64019 length:1290 start_codon:yes stop_codon:yes gene_type:complete